MPLSYYRCSRVFTLSIIALILSSARAWQPRVHSILSSKKITLRSTPSPHILVSCRSQHAKRFTIQASLFDDGGETFNSVSNGFVPLVILTAVGLGLASNGWIGRLLNGSEDGKSGLSAFLKDGQGYSKSGFSMNDEDRAVQSDPLPWLKLPTLDFVEVAGQESNEAALQRQLESLRLAMTEELAEANIKQAEDLRKELEMLMKENGVEFQPPAMDER